MREAWEQFAAAAVLGTDRLAGAPHGAALPPVVVEATPADADAASVLLLQAAALAQFGRCGMRPGPSPVALPAPAEGTQRAPSRRLAALLATVLGERTEVLPECLALLRQCGLDAPPHLLPVLLDLARRERALLEPVTTCLGPVGRWLAAQRPDWRELGKAGAVDHAAEAEQWGTGDREARLGQLRRLRLVDPGFARRLVEGTWREDPAEHRARFLSAFEAGLSMEDEPFLESALDDRGKHVREAAVRLLLRLPESRLVRRMNERAFACVRFRRVPGGRRGDDAIEVDVRPPETMDDALRRDGAEMFVSGRGGLRASLLRTIVAATPPACWIEHAAAPPEGICAAMLETDHAADFAAALAAAVGRYGGGAFVAPLLAWQRNAPVEESVAGTAIHDMLAGVARAGREDILAEHLAPGFLAPLISLADASPALWSDGLSGAAVRIASDLLAQAERDPGAGGELAFGVLRSISLRAAPGVLPAWRDALARANVPGVRKPIADALAIAELRQRLHRLIEEENPA